MLGDGPHFAGAHEACLHLVGDVHRAVPLAELLDSFQVAGRRQREAVGSGNGLHDHGGRIAGLERRSHGVSVVERDVHEVLGLIGQEQLGEPVVAGRHGQSRVPVVGLNDRHDLAALRRVPRGLDGDVDGLAAAATVDDLGQPGRRRLDQGLSQRRSSAGGEVMVADVERAHAGGNGLDQLGIAVAEVVRAAIQVHIDQPKARHIPDEVALPAVDDQVDAGLGPEIGLAGVPEFARLVQDLGLGPDSEDVVVVHRPALVRSGRQRAPLVPVIGEPLSGRSRVAHTRPNHVSVRPNSQAPLFTSAKPTRSIVLAKLVCYGRVPRMALLICGRR